MSLRGDDRGVVVQVGAVILFGFVILAITMYQVQVVPDQNEEVEFNHNERVQDQLLDVRSAIMTTAGGGGSRSVSVTLGTNYPSRTIFLNPSPPYGKLRTVGTTTGSVNITIANAKATNPETADYWNGTNRSYSTGSLVYEPFYHRYDNAPSTVYEHSLLANRFDGATLAQTDQALVDGNEITLVTLNGSLQESGTDGISVDTEDLSVSTQTIRMTNTSGNITLRIPTLLEENVWNESLAGAENVVEPITYRSRPDRRFNVLEVTLKPGNYTLNMAKVGIGSNAETPPGSNDYITSDDPNKTVQAGGVTTLTVQVRDRYNNPVSGKRIDVDPASAVDPDSTRSGDDGTGTFTFEAPNSPGTYTVTTTIDGGGTDEKRVTFTLTVKAPPGGGSSSGAYTIDWRDPTSDNPGTSLSSCSDTECTWDVGKDGDDRLDVTAVFNETIGDLTVEFGVNDTTVADVASVDTSTNSDGEASTDLIANANGTVALFASSGGDSDRIDIRVVNVTSVADSPNLTDLSIIDDSSSNPQGFGSANFTVDYSVDDPGNTFKNVTVTFENTETGITETRSSTSLSERLTYTSNSNFDYGDTYEITVQIYNANGNVVFEQHYDETANGTNENGNVI